LKSRPRTTRSPNTPSIDALTLIARSSSRADPGGARVKLVFDQTPIDEKTVPLSRSVSNSSMPSGIRSHMDPNTGLPFQSKKISRTCTSRPESRNGSGRRRTPSTML
jgi:hypothetical protein